MKAVDTLVGQSNIGIVISINSQHLYTDTEYDNIEGLVPTNV